MPRLSVKGQSVTLGEKLRAFREALGWKQATMARKLNELVGNDDEVTGTRFSEWENDRKPMNNYILAAIALLHPDNPAGCMVWLRGAVTTMPPIRAMMPQDAPIVAKRAKTKPQDVRRRERLIADADQATDAGAPVPGKRKRG